MKPTSDAELMQHADGERRDDALDPTGRAKVDAIHELGELVRGHVELGADAVPDARFDTMWRAIDDAIAPPARAPGLWHRVSRWFDHYRGHIITGAVSAGAVAALALVLRGPSDAGSPGSGGAALDVRPAAFRPTEIESLDTPGGTGTVFNLKDEDGSTTVIWVTPDDSVEGI
ncbi:MAG TPA: hypothetical protein VLX92_10250 [Kofleriaceae bacterium]|nr:hypothetical protein [Kofleriaceae bacterium]